ncbi:MAG: Inner membrane amino-acid ABC transporter permease protein YhdY [Chroococcopsis gigantea SAG 12.99]|jgi:general L-amino acid transport system permease protein|nr:amino acid ABC transporter permease [Chlorogloea purpurea SAG 13.99]MDV2999854.1 Inner membrane amino-acid ABC transporter permease protein YhdY [Chroococcopsis gigantea SAG 12.99]
MIIAWVKNNLFNTWYNVVLTLLSVSFLYWFASGFLFWAFTEARWGVIGDNLPLFFAGRYPVDSQWRLWLIAAIIAFLGGLSWGCLGGGRLLNPPLLVSFSFLGLLCLVLTPVTGVNITAGLLGLLGLLLLTGLSGRRLRGFGPWLGLLWSASFLPVYWLLLGGVGLKVIPIDDLSGLVLTLVTAVISIVLCFPFGVLLALGRQTDLPVIRWLCIAYIEVVRGLPLIGILFMAQVMLPLILPIDVRPDRVIRAIAGFTIFASAYLAENVRGGLQSVSIGQKEAGKALGLNPVLITILIVLPQALKAVIPSLVGQFISLFKDTSLLAIVGLVDLLGMAQSILANPRYIGRYQEVYLFVALIYGIFCYFMSLTSRQLERSLNNEGQTNKISLTKSSNVT